MMMIENAGIYEFQLNFGFWKILDFGLGMAWAFRGLMQAAVAKMPQKLKGLI
jgi:hypothetical protein